MADRRVAIRLGTEGKATVVADLEQLGVTGDAAFNRIARSAAKAARDADQAMEFAQRQATKLAAIMPGLSPGRLDAAAGVRDGVGKSAEASAAVFSSAYGQMEARAQALLRAIDPVRDAQARYNATIGEARGLVAAGVMSLDDYVRVLQSERATLDAVASAHGRSVGSANASRQAMAGASYQVQDFFVQLSMGANPINAFVVQGGQLAGQFMNVEGRAGAVARFLMGPWGLALQIGLMALAPFVAKLWEKSDASKKAEDASKKHREAVLALAEAQEKAILTAERKQALDTAGIKIDLDAAIAVRVRTQSELDRAQAIARMAAAQAMSSSGSADEAIAKEGDLARANALVEQLSKSLADNADKIEKLQRGFDVGYGRMIQQRVEAKSTPEGAIKSRYDRMIAEAISDLSGVANGPRLNAKLNELYAARDRELKAIEKGTQARDREALTANSVAKMLRGELPGVHITSTTGGKHVKNSYHYRNQAVDFVPAGGMNSMTKADVRRIFESRGIQIVELLGPGDKGHSNHFHVAWTKGKLSLDEFTDAAKRAEEAKRDLASLTSQFAPATAAADTYREALAKIAKLNPPNADALRAGAWVEYAQKRAGLFTLDSVESFRPEEDAENKRIADDKARRERAADYAANMLRDQGDRMALAERELQLVGANDNFRDAEMSKLRLILDLRRARVEAGSEDEAQILANAAALDQMADGLRRQEALWGEIRSIGENAIDRLFDPTSAESWGDRIKGILGDLKNEFIKLALLNPLKNLLYGESAPTLGGIFGKLFGGGGNGIVAGDGSVVPVSHGKAFPFATGTEHAPGGTALVGEEGPELVSLPRGSRVTTAAETRRMLAGNDNAAPAVHNHFHLEGAVLTQDLVDQMNVIGNVAATRGAAGGAAVSQAQASARAVRRLGRRW